MYKKLILDKTLDYLKIKKIPVRKNGKILVTPCLKCNSEPHSATSIPNTSSFNCSPCKYKFDLLDIVKYYETDKKDNTEEELLSYLKNLLEIKIPEPKDTDRVKELFEFYKQNNFDLVPVAKNTKEARIEKEWTKKHHKDICEWEHWHESGLNIGLKTGKISQITVIDADLIEKNIKDKIYKGLATKNDLKIAEEQKSKGLDIIRELFKNIDTLEQDTFGGVHLVFKYEEDIPKSSFKYEGITLDIENDGGQVVVEPSIVGDKKRKIKQNIITKMPEHIKKLILENVKKPSKPDSEIIREDILSGDFKIDPSDFKLINNGLDGNCNASFIKLGGIIRKELNIKQTAYVLKALNRHMLEDPMNNYTIERMVEQLDKYVKFDEEDLSHQIMEYLKITEGASKAEIEIAVLGKRATGEDKKKIDKCLVYLIKEEKIGKRGRIYVLLKSMEWQESLINVGKPINFKVPYLDEYAHFNWGDLIMIGSKTKTGKTTLAMNVVNEFVKQGIKPYYIYSESGGRFSKTALHLGLKDGDFKHIFASKPDEISLEPNSIVVYDWIRPTGGFNTTDELYDNLVQKLEKTQSFMVCFVQLKVNNEWFAPNLIAQFPALACKYMYQNENDGKNTYFHITEVRDPKMNGKEFKIPCVYKWETKEVIKEDI